MSFDWQHWLDRNGISYSTTGKNIARGHLVIHCPFCGRADEGQHLEVNLHGRGWRCFRQPRIHKGRNPTKLVQALLGCSWEAAAAIAGSGAGLPNDFFQTVKNKMDPPKPRLAKKLTLPNEFKSFNELMPSRRLFADYLRKRGFYDKDISRMTSDYGIRYCTNGSYKGRIIFPVHYMNKLVTWTGRTVYPSVELRYKTLSINTEKAEIEGVPQAAGSITEYLLWYDDLKKSYARTIVLVEGPFDALRVSVLGYNHGIDATCFFTMQPSVSQIDKLHEILPKYKNRYLLLDQGTTSTSLMVASALSSFNVKVKQLPSGTKDPGELGLNDLLEIVA
jgi:hypothetical protein